MPFSRPSLSALRNQAIQDVTTSGVPGLTGLLRNAVLRVMAWAMAGLAYSVYGYGDWIARMGVPFTARGEFLYAWAALIGVYSKDATAASGQARFTGVTGRVLPADTPLTRQDGTPYITTADGTVDASGYVTVPMTADVPGAATDCDAGTPISIAHNVAGINAGGETVGPCSGGADQELDDAMRTRMLAKYRDPPQGGAHADYLEWASEVPGCTRAWAEPNGYGLGSVIVYPMFDDVRAEHGGFPQGTDGLAAGDPRGPTATGDQALVAEHLWTPQPVTARVWIVAPGPHPIDVRLDALDPNTEAMHATIIASLEDMFLAVGAVAGTVFPSQLYDAILAAPGIRHFAMSSPSAPVEAPPATLPVLGTFHAPLIAT